MEQRCMYMRHDPNGGPGQSEGEKKKERDINLYISMTREGDPANQKVRRKKSVWCYALCCVLRCDACCVLCCDACGSLAALYSLLQKLTRPPFFLPKVCYPTVANVNGRIWRDETPTDQLPPWKVR